MIFSQSHSQTKLKMQKFILSSQKTFNIDEVIKILYITFFLPLNMQLHVYQQTHNNGFLVEIGKLFYKLAFFFLH